MKNGKLRLGFVGCGSIANYKHFPSLGMYDDVAEMAAFCDIILPRAKAAARQYGTDDAKVYEDYRELLADPEIDAVYVLTPNAVHCEITVAALDAGKHVLCEKPMATTAKEAKEMVAARDRNGKMLTVGYQYRHFDVNKTAKAVVDAGYLGDIYYAEAVNMRRRGVPTWGVFTDKEKQGGGALIDIGTHSLDLVLWMMNDYDVDYVVGTAFEKLGKLLPPGEQGQKRFFDGADDPWDNETFDVDDFAVGFIKMKSGAVINLKASWAVNIDEQAGANSAATVLLAGTKGGLNTIDEAVRLNHIVADQMTVSYVGKKASEGLPGFSDSKPTESMETKIWINALRGQGDLFVTADQACVVSCILDAIYESSKTGKPVYF